jgi:hypothetical protein
MNNAEIAKKLSEVVYMPVKDGSFEFAVQLFLEEVVLPSDVSSYTQQGMEDYILKYLRNRI